MSLQQLQGSTTQNGPMFLHNGMFQPGPGMSILQPSPPSVSPIGGGGGLASIGDQLPQLPFRPPGLGGYDLGGPIRPPHYISPMPIRPQPPMLQPIMPDYSSQFEKFGEQLTGFGDQMTGYQDALGSFNEQVGGMGKQFETITNRLDSVDKGLGSLGNQIASLENMQKAQPQEVMQPQRPAFNPFGFGGFGGLGSLFGRRY